MAMLNCEFFSEVLGQGMSMTVILPQASKRAIGVETNAPVGDASTLYLLHGLSDNHSTWLRRTSIERYVDPLGLAVVMPAVHRSFYTDMVHGGKYWTYISEEVPAVARRLFRLSSQREHNFVAGLSMGGYGAFKLAFRKPDCFAAAASLSGALHPEFICAERTAVLAPELGDIFGDLANFRGSANDLLHLAGQLAAAAGPKPKLYQCCGTEDFLYTNNCKFHEYLAALPLEHTFEDGPGVHSWNYWDAMIQRVLAWLPLCT